MLPLTPWSEGGVTLTVISRHVASVLLGQGLVSRSASIGVCLTESERARDGKTDRTKRGVDTGQAKDRQKGG